MNVLHAYSDWVSLDAQAIDPKSSPVALLSEAKCHTTWWKFSNHCKSKPNWSEGVYADGGCVIFFAFWIRGPWFLRHALVSISDEFRSAAFSGLRNATTSVGYYCPVRNHGATHPQDFAYAESDGQKRSRCAGEIATNRRSFVVWGQHQGKQTASGTIFDQAQLTAAHPSLPFGTKIKVTNLANGKSVEVEITDRGPVAENRIIDLSQAAAKALGMIDSGTATVRLELPSGQ